MDAYERFKRYRVDDVQSVAEFLDRYYKPDRYKGRGESHAASLLASYERDVSKDGYCAISHHDSVTSNVVSWYPPEGYALPSPRPEPPPDYEHYTPWMRQLARTHTRAELERMLTKAKKDGAQATAAHLRAVQRTTSMTSQSQARAHARNSVQLAGDTQLAVSGAMEIYDVFPEHTKEGKDAQE